MFYVGQCANLNVSTPAHFRYYLGSVRPEDIRCTMSTLDWDLATPYTMSIRVKPEDIDRLGHTNNQVYLRWMEELSWQHVESIGFGWDLYEQFQRAMAIRRTEVDYLGACYQGDELMMATWITGCDGRLHSERRFQLIRVEDGRTVLRAKVTYVCIDLANGRPRRMPPEYVEFHERVLVAEDPASGT